MASNVDEAEFFSGVTYEPYDFSGGIGGVGPTPGQLAGGGPGAGSLRVRLDAGSDEASVPPSAAVPSLLRFLVVRLVALSSVVGAVDSDGAEVDVCEKEDEGGTDDEW